MVFVVDEYGGVEGIVTLQDVVDELLAGLMESHDGSRRTGDGTEPAEAPSLAGAAAAVPSRLEVPGDTPLHELAGHLGLPEWPAGSGIVTVGGFIVARLGRVPEVGEEVVENGVLLRVIESDTRVVLRVAVELVAPPAAGGEREGGASE
jgi:CBS domain containing-hemolysin-like protein